MNDISMDSELESLINSGDFEQEPPPPPQPSTEDSRPRLPQQDLSFFGKIPVQVTLEVASVQLPLKDLMEVDANSVITLDKLAGELLDVKVNGSLFAKGEVVVMNGNYGIRIIELTDSGLKGIAS